jgi:ribosomal protein L11 methyltransferase
MYLELSLELGALDSQAAESAAFGCGAFAVTFVDAHDDPVSRGANSGLTLGARSSPLPVLEPAPGEVRLWPSTRMKCLFAPQPGQDLPGLRAALGAALGIDAALLDTQWIAERAWEREWLADSHALRFGRRLWVCPHHERVTTADAVVAALDPGLAFGTGRHASTALCLEWLDAHLHESPEPAEHSAKRRAHGLDAHLHESPEPAEHSAKRRAHGLDAHLHESPQHTCVIDYGCGSGVLALAAVKLGAREAHCFDLDPQALIATRANAQANGISAQVHVHDRRAGLPGGVDVLLANILAGPLCALAHQFALLVRPGGEVVLAGLREHEVAEVTGAYAACFDVARFGDRDGWVCLAGRRH